MKPSAYASYKPSGVAWLGDVPEHWALRSLRYAATIQNGSDFKEHEVEEGGYPVLGSGGEFARISKFIYDQPSVLLGRKGTIDNPLYIEEPFWTVDTLFYTKIANDTHPKFFYWFCTSIPFGYFQYGSAVPSMTQNDLYAIKVPTPALEEQQTIANFLDAQTAKIDTLLAKKRQFIDKLKEKRSTLIARTVTRGLPPDAAQAAGLEPHPAMEDSGVEWLGQIPAHWQMKRLISQFKSVGGGTPSKANSEFWDGDIPWVSPKDMSSRIITDTEDHITLEAISESATKIVPQDATLVVVRSGILRHTIPVATNLVAMALNQDMKALIAIGEVTNKYLVYFIEGHNRSLLNAWTKSGCTVESIESSFMLNTVLPVPPGPEQQAIAAYLDRETARIDQLTAKVEAAISCLTEYRQALITAAVTGKIDVRARTVG